MVGQSDLEPITIATFGITFSLKSHFMNLGEINPLKFWTHIVAYSLQHRNHPNGSFANVYWRAVLVQFHVIQC